MRTSVRNTLLALALAATPLGTAHAALFDGAENTGVPCAYTPESDTGNRHIGILTGGPWAAVDVVENNQGIVGVDDQPGAATNLRLTCELRTGYANATVAARNSATSPAGAVVMAPALVSYDSSYTNRRLCTTLEWTSNSGPHSDTTCEDI